MTTRFGALTSGSTIESIIAAAGGTQSLFETRTAAVAATIDVAVKSLRTAGYAAPGDGGHGLYARLQTAPTTPTNKAYFRSIDRVRVDGTTDATHGGYWALVPEGGEVRPEQFGAKADYNGSVIVTDSYQAIMDAITFAAWSFNVTLFYSYTIRLSAGRYYSSQMIGIHRSTHIKGVGGGNFTAGGGPASQIHFPDNTTCFLISQNNTTGETGGPTGNLGIGGGTLLEGFGIHAGGTQTTHAGVHVRTTSYLRDLYIETPPGDGIRIHGTSGSGGAEEGGPNEWKIENVFVFGGPATRHGLWVYGSDANAGNCNGFTTQGECLGCGVLDESGLGATTYTNLQISGFPFGGAGVHYLGRHYSLVRNDPAGAAVTPGTSLDTWEDVGPGSADAFYPTWVSGGTYAPRHPIAIFGASNRCVVVAPYVESSGKAKVHVDQPSIGIGGQCGYTARSNAFFGQSAKRGLFNYNGVGGYLTFLPGTPEYTGNGGATWAMTGVRAIEGLITAVDGGMQFLQHGRDIDGAEYEWGYQGRDIRYRRVNGTMFWRQTTTSSTEQLGRGVAQPDKLILNDPAFENPDDTPRVIGYRSSIPTTGTHAQGEVMFNANAAAAGFVGWVCVTAGTPGTWKTFGAISA